MVKADPPPIMRAVFQRRAAADFAEVARWAQWRGRFVTAHLPRPPLNRQPAAERAEHDRHGDQSEHAHQPRQHLGHLLASLLRVVEAQVHHALSVLFH